MDIQSIHTIFSEIANLHLLQELNINLSKLNIGCIQVQHLGLALQACQHINHLNLNLEMNSILDSGHNILTESLGKILTLTSIKVNLSRNGLIKRGLRVFDVFQSNSQIRSFGVDLSENRIDLQSELEILNRMQNGPKTLFNSLEELQISFNDFQSSLYGNQIQSSLNSTYLQFLTMLLKSNDSNLSQFQLICPGGAFDSESFNKILPLLSQKKQLKELCIKVQSYIGFQSNFESACNSFESFQKLEKLVFSFENLDIRTNSSGINFGKLTSLKSLTLDFSRQITNTTSLVSNEFMLDLFTSLNTLPEKLQELFIICTNRNISLAMVKVLNEILQYFNQLKSISLNFSGSKFITDEAIVKIMDPIKEMGKIRFVNLCLENTSITRFGVGCIFDGINQISQTLLSLNLNLQVQNCRFPEIANKYQTTMDGLQLLQKSVTLFSGGGSQMVREYRNQAFARQKLLYLCKYMQQCVMRGFFRKQVIWETLFFLMAEQNSIFYIP